jgi:hypothetical protein
MKDTLRKYSRQDKQDMEYMYIMTILAYLPEFDASDIRVIWMQWVG